MSILTAYLKLSRDYALRLRNYINHSLNLLLVSFVYFSSSVLQYSNVDIFTAFNKVFNCQK